MLDDSSGKDGDTTGLVVSVRRTRFTLKPLHPQFFRPLNFPHFLHQLRWDGGLRGIRTMSTLCVAGWQKGRQRQEWQSCGPIGQRPVTRSSCGDTGAVHSRKRSFTAVSSDQVDEFRVELPTLPRVSVAVVAKNLGPPHPSTAWRVLQNRLKQKAYKGINLSGCQLPPVSVAWRFCRCIRLRLGARLRLSKGPSLPTLSVQRVYFSDEKIYKCEYLQQLQVLGGPRPKAHGLRRPSPHRQVSVQVSWWPWSLVGMASQACPLWNQGSRSTVPSTANTC